MATLSVWKFETPSGAEQAEDMLQDLQSRALIQVLDGAIVTWEQDKKKPKTKQLRSFTGAGALGGAFWGFLFGLLFFVPFLGLAVGAATGALTGSLAKVGIDDGFLKRVQAQMKPGTSALFVFTQNAVVDKVADAFRGVQAELIETNLSVEQEKALREAFDES